MRFKAFHFQNTPINGNGKSRHKDVAMHVKTRIMRLKNLILGASSDFSNHSYPFLFHLLRSLSAVITNS